MRTDLINWSRFEQCNSANLTSAFENMCRMQFNRFFFDGKAILTSSPNNPGIEVEPVSHLSTNKRISFQAKYFISNIDYGSIERSMKTAIMNYSGKLDVIYLYCNKDFTHTAPSFVECKDALCAANICLITVTNVEILNQIIENRYLVIAAKYFQNESINAGWFAQKAELSLSELEPRYARGFNVEVKYEQQLSLFAFMQGAIDYLNNKRADTIKGIKDLRPFLSKYWDFIDETIIRLKNISDINTGNILDCLGWHDSICEGRNLEIAVMEKELDELISKVYSEKDENRRKNLLNERTYLKRFLDELHDIRIEESERNLLQNKVLVLTGSAGTGKSHLLGTFSKIRIDSGDPTILLLGQAFLSDRPVEQQILEDLGLNYSFDELLDILDGIGIEKNRQVIIIIDAINESTNKDIWKSSLTRIFDKIETCQNIRLILSIRTGYERLTFTDAVIKRINNGSVSQIVHYGFADNTIEATMQFFDYYKISFGASDLLQHEFSNPLMLKLYCETRKSNPVSLFDMFEAYVSYVDEETKSICGIDFDGNLLKKLVIEIINEFLKFDTEHINQDALFSLEFWTIYGIADKTKYLSALSRRGFISQMVLSRSDENTDEVYYFAYQKSADYYTAQAIMAKYDDEAALRAFITKTVLVIEDKRITNWSRRGVFIILCGLFAQKFQKECIDILDEMDTTDISLFEDYIESFAWRRVDSINSYDLMEFVHKNNYVNVQKALLRLLFNTSAIINHPLNADFLHSWLFKMSLNGRDYIWTTYVNGVSIDNRAYYLAELFQKGGTIGILKTDEKRLLSTLYCWMLSSSKRSLRDNVSECLIELLKNDLSHCINLIEEFSEVNDPYVIQRLYGIILGICLKSSNIEIADFRILAEQVFERVFNVEYVYPDIMLRDYARLIIERFLYLYPDDSSKIIVSKVRPPYRSFDIPVVQPVDYYKGGKHSGLNSIIRSMTPNVQNLGIGMYGDFGRYVWQSAIKDFEGINDDSIVNLYYYTMRAIVEDLGYKDDLFGDYDLNLNSFVLSRHDTVKTERIGKKYQWIMFYNTLARMSDRHKVDNINSVDDYRGTWNPYVRDFDPTLNTQKQLSVTLPKIEIPNMNITIEWIPDKSAMDVDRERWTISNSLFFQKHEDNLLVKHEATEWVALFQYCCRKSDEMAEHHELDTRTAQEIWSMSFSYLTSPNDCERIMASMRDKPINRGDFPEGWEIYSLFNREYCWAPGYLEVFSDYWREIDEHGSDIDKGYNRNKPIGKIMPTYIDFSWQELYDASQQGSTGFHIPCGMIVNGLGLHQKEDDGLFYSGDELVAFDTRFFKIQDSHLLVIRKNYLMHFLKEHNLSLFWFCIGEKQSFLAYPDGQKWSSWSGLYSLNNGKVNGEFRRDINK